MKKNINELTNFNKNKTDNIINTYTDLDIIDELKKIIEAIQISKKTNRIIKENLIFSIGVKILILLLSLLGIADMWEAVFADVGTTLITIFNTIRILK